MNRGAGNELAALRQARERAWRLEFEQDGGIPWVWTGVAASAEAAENVARADLAQDHAEFNASTARLVACLER